MGKQSAELTVCKEKDCIGILQPQDDPFIISVEIVNYENRSMSAMVCYASAIKLNTKMTTDWFVQTPGGSLTLNPNSC
ncbi:hypothetical protein EV1_034630 [Malus domestica]